MPSLFLLATSPQLLSAALAATIPHTPPLPELAPQTWSLAAAQETQPVERPVPDDTAPLPATGEEPAESEGREIVVEGEYGPPAGDPAEQFNQDSYRITQAVDAAVIEPVADAYRDNLPRPIRDGLGNVVRNLGEPSNALNFLLQGKVGKAFETLGRLAINSTVGVGGLFDVAGKPAVGLPYRRNGFANTMGYYGVGPGPYLYIPVTGATSVRDLIGNTLDQALLPFAVGKPFNQTGFAASYFLVNGLDRRIELDDELAGIEASEDPYALRRDTYLARREREIAALKGEAAQEEPASDAPSGQSARPDGPSLQSDLSLPERLQIPAGTAPEGR